MRLGGRSTNLMRLWGQDGPVVDPAPIVRRTTYWTTKTYPTRHDLVGTTNKIRD